MLKTLLQSKPILVCLNFAYLVLSFLLTGAFGFGIALCWAVYFGLPFGGGPSIGKWMRERSRIAHQKEPADGSGTHPPQD